MIDVDNGVNAVLTFCFGSFVERNETIHKETHQFHETIQGYFVF